MEKEHLRLLPVEYDGAHNETNLTKRIDQKNSRGFIIFQKKTTKKKRSFKGMRIRSFFIRHTKFKRPMEFSCHPNGVHLLRLAVFYSETGCELCRIYVEKNLF